MSPKNGHHQAGTSSRTVHFVAGILVGIFGTNMVSFLSLSHYQSALLSPPLVSPTVNRRMFQDNVHNNHNHYVTGNYPFKQSQRHIYCNNYKNQDDNQNNKLRQLNKDAKEDHNQHKNDAGWSLINVFYGNTSHLPYVSTIRPEYYFNENDHNNREEETRVRVKGQRSWFSQLRQDEVVSALLKKKTNGYFIDLAANDAVRISNTYALQRDFNWTGLCIEPNPIYWASLSYRGGNCHVIGAVVGPSTMQEVKFKFPNRAGPTGGIVGSGFDNKDPSKFNEDSPRYTVSLTDIFERFDTPRVIDYLSLDVEGAEDYIMEYFPFDEYRLRVLTVERPSPKLRNLLQTKEYVQLKQMTKKQIGETLWVHQSEMDDNNNIDLSALKIDTENYRYSEK